MTRRWGPGVVGVVALIALSGCTSVAPATRPPTSASPSAPSAPSATASVAAPLTCAELVDSSLIEQAMQSPAAPADFPHLWLEKRGYEELRSYAVEAAGGLSCAWAAVPDSADEPWLQVNVLPGAPASVSPYLYGDGPTDQTRQIGTRVVTAACGDPGCGTTAVVNGRWVDIRLNIPGFGTTGTPLGSSDAIFDHAEPAMAAIFDTVAEATPAQVAWPPTSTLTASEQQAGLGGVELCESYLSTTMLGATLGDQAVSWELANVPPALVGISDLALERMGAVQCQATGPHFVQVDIAPGNAWIAADIGSNPRNRRVLEETVLTGQVPPEVAYTDCAAGDLSICTAVFSLGTATVWVTGDGGSRAIADAITSHAR